MEQCVLPPQWRDWKIVEEIGEGAYGVVYRAEKENGDIRAVSAIKVVNIPSEKSQLRELMRELQSEATTRKYLKDLADQCANEIRTMYLLQSDSNIVSIQDHFIQEEESGLGFRIFIRMELLESFSDYAVTKQFGERDIINLGISLLNAIMRCENANILHRDIKPGNIFLTPSGEYKLGDFGIARVLEGTNANYSAKGTYNYMAPEVYMGKKYGKNADVYSLGLILYKLANRNLEPFIDLSKQMVYYKDREQAFERRMNAEALPSPADAGAELSKIILKACAYDPQKRYASAADMKADLEALQSKLNAGSDRRDKKKIPVVPIALSASALILMMVLILYALNKPSETGANQAHAPTPTPAITAYITPTPTPAPTTHQTNETDGLFSFGGIAFDVPDHFIYPSKHYKNQYVFQGETTGDSFANIEFHTKGLELTSAEFKAQKQDIVAEIKDKFKPLALMQLQDITVAGLSGQSFYMRFSNEDGNTVKCKMAFCHNDSAGILVTIALYMSENADDKYYDDFDRIMKTAFPDPAEGI